MNGLRLARPNVSEQSDKAGEKSISAAVAEWHRCVKAKRAGGHHVVRDGMTETHLQVSCARRIF